MKRLVIVNPAAGSGLNPEHVDHLKNLLEGSEQPFKIVVSEGPNHIYEMCESLTSDYSEVIIAGGDGSVQEVIKAVLDKDMIVSIIPSGTGNDFYKSLYPNYQSLSLYKIIEQVFTTQAKKINICSANGQVFINVASIGLDAKIVENSFKLRKWIHSSKTYLISALWTILFYTPKSYTVISDEKEQTVYAYLIAVGNGKYYGGGMAITPQAKIEDQTVDICLVKKMNRLKLLKLLPTVYNGKHLQFEEVVYWKAKSVKILSHSTELLNLDGELTENDHLNVSADYGSLLMR